MPGRAVRICIIGKGPYSRVRLCLQFYGSQKGDTVFFGDKGAKKFGSYWVDGGKGAHLHTVASDRHEQLCAALFGPNKVLVCE